MSLSFTGQLCPAGPPSSQRLFVSLSEDTPLPGEEVTGAELSQFLSEEFYPFTKDLSALLQAGYCLTFLVPSAISQLVSQKKTQCHLLFFPYGKGRDHELIPQSFL